MSELNRDPGRPPAEFRDLDFQNVTGATFTPPYDLDGYLDEPEMKFGFHVGPSEDEAELLGFKIDATQLRAFAIAFEAAADHLDELDGDDA